MYGCFQDRVDAFFVLKYEANGSLASLLERHNVFTIEFAQNLTVDILLGLAYLHTNNIIHADMKPSNVLVDKNYRAMIGDFGLCKSNSEKYTGVWGTRVYQSPEQLSTTEQWDAKVDIFVVGVMLIEMITGQHPFVGSAKDEAGILENIRNLTLRFPPVFHPGVMSFMHLTVCPQNFRMSVEQCIKHHLIHPRFNRFV